MFDYESNPEAKGVEYQITEVDPTDSETKGKVYQVYKVTEEIAATMAGKIYRARIIKDPTEPTIIGKVYQVVFIDDPDDPSVRGKVYNAIVTGAGQAVVVGPGVSPLILPDALSEEIISLIAFGGTKQGVPDGYTLVEYLQSDGNQNIKTDINGINTRIEVDAQYTGTSTAQIRMLATYDSNYTATYFGVYSNQWALGSSTKIGDATVRSLVKCAFSVESDGYNTATLVVGQDTTTYTRNTVRSDKALYILGTGSYKFIGKVYSFKIFDKNTNELLFDGVPAVRNSDSAAGLYDAVSGRFFENIGTGSFAVGSSIVPVPTAPIDIVSNNGTLKVKDSELPLGYKRLLGYTCNNDVLWQITGFHLRGSDTVRISFSIDGACNVFGCYQGTTATDNYDLYVTITAGGKYFRYGDGTYLSYWSNDNIGQRFDVVFSPTGTTGMPQDSTWLPLTFEAANDMLIGSTTLTGTSAKMKGNFYGNIIVDGRLKLIPCERVSDGVMGYFDTYSQTFFEPTGTPTSLGYDYSYTPELYVDGTVETIGFSTRNLFNPNSNWNINASCQYVSNSMSFPSVEGGNRGTYFMKVKPNTTYTVSAKTAGDRLYVGELTTEVDPTTYTTGNRLTFDNVLLNVTDPDTVYTFTTGINTVMIGVYYSLNTYPTEFQIETGGTPTDYIEYNNSTATCEMLLATPNYVDEQDVISGAIKRNNSVLIATGSQDWKASTTSDVYYLRTPDGLNSRVATISTHFVGTTAINNAMPNNTTKLTLVSSEEEYAAIYVKMTSAGSLSGFENFLDTEFAAGRPVIFMYPKKTTSSEHVSPQPMETVQGDNTLEITQASIGGLELEVTYMAGVSLTIEEIEDAQLSPDVEVTIL